MKVKISFVIYRGTPFLSTEASAEENEAVFNSFLAEGKSAFKRYHVVYLNGICIPEKYEDLLKPPRKSNYSDISWQGSQPSGINFSLSQHSFTIDEINAHVLDVRTHLSNTIIGWM